VMDAEAGEGELTWSDFIAGGAELEARDPSAFAKAREGLTSDKLATIVYTSGTTGPPKGAMLSHRNLMFQAAEVAAHAKFPAGEETLSFLPLSHVVERLQGEVIAVKLGLTVNFAGSIDTVRDDLRAVRPTILLAVPRLWEKIHEGILAKVREMPERRRKVFAWAVQVGRERFRAEVEKRPLSWAQRAQALLADRLVGRTVRAELGLDRARYLITGAAPMSLAVQEFFGALGMPLLEGYGQTECTGISHATIPELGVRPGRVGTRLANVEVRIAADGEILVRGENVFMGYFKEEAATALALQGGWLHTGDVGEVDEAGYLRLTDRKKDILVTSGGKNVAPQNLETRLKAFQGISQVVVLGDGRKHLVALITIERESMAKVVERAVTAPSRDTAVRAYIQRCVDALNAELSSFETIKRFRVLEEDFTLESGELTPTLKVRRRVVEDRHRALVDAMYEEGERHLVG
jgi:long-chain acyl-CoA synthetase